MTRNVLVIITI